MMTLANATALAIPDLDPLIASVPPLFLSFVLTVLQSFVKFFDWQSKMSESKAEADHLRSCAADMEKRRSHLEVQLALQDKTVTEPDLQLAEAALQAGLEQEHLSCRSLLQLSPQVVLKFEKQQLETSLKKQKQKISEETGKLVQQTFIDIRQIYQTMIANRSDVGESQMQNRLSEVETLLEIQKKLMRHHSELSERAVNFGKVMRKEEMEARRKFWVQPLLRLLSRLGRKCCPQDNDGEGRGGRLDGEGDA